MAREIALKWGKMTLEYAPITGGAIGTFAKIETPVQDSFQLNTEEGNVLEAFIEGGERIAKRQDSNKYSFEFDLFVSGADSKPIQDVDGVVAGEYALRVIPENASLPGFLMERCAVSVTETFTSADGHKAHYVFEALKPEEGAMLKPYTVPEG